MTDQEAAAGGGAARAQPVERPRPGPNNDLTDVSGVVVGHATHPTAPTGATVVLPPAFSRAGVDQRGLAPATIETDALKPANSVGGVHAVVLSGGSIFGLAAASAAGRVLSKAGLGLRVTPNAPAVPIAPGAAIYDLDGLGPDWPRSEEATHAELGASAAAQALERLRSGPGAVVEIGLVGAGRGARAASASGGAIPGGLGMASWRDASGRTIAALIVVNPVGSPYMPDGRTLWAWPFEIDGEFGGARPDPSANRAPPAMATKLGPTAPLLNTVIGCVATDADLTSEEATRLAQMAQAGVTRAVRPAHTPFDGDTLFAFATGARPLAATPEARATALLHLGSDAADCVARALCRGVHAANSAGGAAAENR